MTIKVILSPLSDFAYSAGINLIETEAYDVNKSIIEVNVMSQNQLRMMAKRHFKEIQEVYRIRLTDIDSNGEAYEGEASTLFEACQKVKELSPYDWKEQFLKDAQTRKDSCELKKSNFIETYYPVVTTLDAKMTA